MNALLAILKLLPTILSAAIESVHAIESGFSAVATATGSTVAGAGAEKASVLEAALQSILTEEAALVSAVPVDLISKVFAAVRDAAVAAFKKLGIFKSSTPATPAA